MATTRYYATRDEWLAARRLGIGGSDAAAILGYDPYRTPLDVWREKMGTAAPRAESPHMARGNALEPLVAEMVRREPGVREVRTAHAVAMKTPYWLLAHVTHPTLVASPDGFVGPGTLPKPGLAMRLDVLEIKCPSAGAFRKWQRDGLPAQYLIQMQHYLMVTGCSAGHFAIFCADSWQLWMVPVERDKKLIAQMEAILPQWYDDHVVTGVEPAMPETFSYAALLGGSGAETITDTKTLEAAAMALRGKESLALAQEFADATKEELLDLLPKHTGTFVCGDVRVKREAVKGRTTFDKDKIDGTTVAPVNVPMLAGALLAYRAIGSIGDADRIVREHTVPAAYFEKTGKPSERITIEPVSGAKA